jgi:hypothetical protein
MASTRSIDIDDFGARMPRVSLKGLRAYGAQGAAQAREVLTSPIPRKFGTRRGIAQGLAVHLADDGPTIASNDHGLSFVLRFFELPELQPDWPAFLEDLQRHVPRACRAHRCRCHAPRPGALRRNARRRSPLAPDGRAT